MEGWEAKVVFMPGRMANAVYLTRKRYNGRREYLLSDNTLVTTQPDNMPLKDDPAFAYLDTDQLKALAKAFDKFDIKLPDAGFVQGKLEATEKHLEDMRSIVGHVKKIKLQEGK